MQNERVAGGQQIFKHQASSGSEPDLVPFHNRRDFVRAFPVPLGSSARFGDLAVRLAPDLEARRAPGTFPIRGSPARTSAHARSAASSKSFASPLETCQPVPFFPNTSL